MKFLYDQKWKKGGVCPIMADNFFVQFFFLDACVGDFGSQLQGKIALSEEDSLRSNNPNYLILSISQRSKSKFELNFVLLVLALPACGTGSSAVLNLILTCTGMATACYWDRYCV